MYVKHKFGAKFDYYECQAVTVVVHVVSVQSFQFGSASWSFEMGFDVWLSAMSCVRMSGCQRCLVCGCLAVSDVLSAAGDCDLKQRSQPAAVSILLYNIVTIV